LPQRIENMESALGIAADLDDPTPVNTALARPLAARAGAVRAG
jgi:hypothetical protein